MESGKGNAEDRKREREWGGGRHAAEGRGCDVTAQQCQRLPQKGQRRQKGAVSHGEGQGGMQKQRQGNSGQVHTKPAIFKERVK